jgi:hypothetical protein
MQKQNTVDLLPKLTKYVSESFLEKQDSFKSLIRFDKIRASKLLELIQDGLIIFTLAFIIGSFLDKFFKINKPDDEISNTRLVLEVVLQFSIIIVLAYYIGKIAQTIPFVLSLTPDYESNLKGEASSSAGLAMTIIFVGIQKNFLYKIGLLRKRFAFNE